MTSEVGVDRVQDENDDGTPAFIIIPHTDPTTGLVYNESKPKYKMPPKSIKRIFRFIFPKLIILHFFGIFLNN